MVCGEGLRDTPVWGPFGEPVPDGSRDLPIVLLCAAWMSIGNATRLCYLNQWFK